MDRTQQSRKENFVHFIKSAFRFGGNIEKIDISVDYEVSDCEGFVPVSEIIFRNLRVLRFDKAIINLESFLRVVEKNILLETIHYTENRSGGK